MKYSALAEHNTHLSLNQHIYSDPARPNHTGGLSSYLAISVPQLFANVKDARLFSYDLEQHLDTPELRDAFSPSPYNVLRACDFECLNMRENALDLTQDFGGTAQYLAERFTRVDAVKIEAEKALLSHQRFASTLNISHFACDLDTLTLPSKNYDLIYVGNFDELGTDKASHQILLAKLNASLREGGVLLFSLTNRHRLSAWLNHDPHECAPLTPLLNLYRPEKDVFFNLPELQNALQELGVESPNINASFSANGDLTNLFTLDYLDQNKNSLNHFYRIGSVANSQVNEYLLYKAQQAEGHHLSHLASRYVVSVSDSPKIAHALYARDFCHFPGKSRRPEWRAITSKATDQDTVTKERTMVDHKRTSRLLSQCLEPQSFKLGILLIDDWLDAIVNRDGNAFAVLIQDYHSWLTEHAKADKFSEYGYDLLPFNIVCTGDKSTGESSEIGNKTTNREKKDYKIIDPEWSVNERLSADFVLFRALFWFAFENRALMSGFTDHWGLQTIGSFVEHYLNVTCGECDTNSFIALEERLQSEISQTFNSGSVSLAMHHGFSTTHGKSLELAHATANTQITWANEQDQFDQAHTVNLKWRPSAELQHLETGFCHTDSNKLILRVDPLDNAGLFQFEAITLLDKQNQTLWSLSSSSEITDFAELRNVIATEDEKQVYKNFVALNDDPFLLFDLSRVLSDESLRGSIKKIALSISLSHEPNYNKALNELTSIVGQQAYSIKTLSNKANETRADIDQLHAKLARCEHSRSHLQQRLENMDSIVEQNHQLHAALLRTPSARLKRIAQKLFKLLGQRK